MEQRSSEWHQARKGRVTASMVGAILGIAPYLTRNQCLRRMVRDALGAEPEFTGNIATEYGTYNEPEALLDYRLDHEEHDVEAVGFIAFEDWAGASPDGLLGDNGLLEIKCPFGKRNDAEPQFKPISEQPHYYAQVQFQLYCTDREWADFYQWSPNGSKIETVLMDMAWRDENLPKLRQFYAEYLDALKDPSEHLAPARVEIDGMTAAKMLAEYDEMADAKDRAESRMKEIKDELVIMAGDKSALVCGRKLTKVEAKGAVQYAKALKAAAPDFDVEPYRGKPSTSWRLT